MAVWMLMHRGWDGPPQQPVLVLLHPPLHPCTATAGVGWQFFFCGGGVKHMFHDGFGSLFCVKHGWLVEGFLDISPYTSPVFKGQKNCFFHFCGNPRWDKTSYQHAKHPKHSIVCPIILRYQSFHLFYKCMVSQKRRTKNGRFGTFGFPFHEFFLFPKRPN